MIMLLVKQLSTIQTCVFIFSMSATLKSH